MSPRAPSRNPLKPKERMAIPRQEMPQADPAKRARTYDEANLGFELLKFAPTVPQPGEPTHAQRSNA